MRRKPGVPAPHLTLPAIDGTAFNTEALKGQRYMLSFFRFATCPFCNLRVHQLVQRYEELESLPIVAIFDSPLVHLKKHAAGHQAPFPILADEKNRYYKVYGIEKSLGGMLKGMILRFPTLLKGMFSGYIPLPIRGSLITMPADFLVDEQGVIHTAYYGADEGDHLSFNQIKAFAQARSS